MREKRLYFKAFHLRFVQGRCRGSVPVVSLAGTQTVYWIVFSDNKSHWVERNLRQSPQWFSLIQFLLVSCNQSVDTKQLADVERQM